jgi:hypothetical protein
MIKRLENLLSLKSIITLAVTASVLYLVLRNMAVPDILATPFGFIIGSFWQYQANGKGVMNG